MCSSLSNCDNAAVATARTFSASFPAVAGKKMCRAGPSPHEQFLRYSTVKSFESD